MKSKALLTGWNGFLGRYIYSSVSTNYELTTIGRNNQSTIKADLAQEVPRVSSFFDLVIHNAGKAHTIPQNKDEARVFFDVNYQGTLNLLKALEDNPPRQFVFISTVAVYGSETGLKIKESTFLQAQTPYARSKRDAELAIIDWSQRNDVKYLILRLPLVVGANPPGNLGKIISAIERGRYLAIMDNNAFKSVVLAKDVAVLISQVKDKEGTYNLTDGKHPSFSEIEQAIATGLGRQMPIAIPITFLRLGASIGDIIEKCGFSFPLTSNRLRKMTSSLTFDDEKARSELDWNPSSVLDFLNQGLFKY